jgi:hypothetical protein
MAASTVETRRGPVVGATGPLWTNGRKRKAMLPRTMPAGKYADWTLTRIPPAYLLWLLRNPPRWLTPALAEAIRRELTRLAVDASREGYEPTLYEPMRN